MANAVRKICTKIGNGHQYLLGTAKTSAYSGHVISDIVLQHSIGLQVEKKCKLNYADHLLSQSQSLYYVDQRIENKQFMESTVQLLNKCNRPINNIGCISDLTIVNSNSIKPNDSLKSNSSDNNDLKYKGLPSEEQLNYVYDKLGETLPTMFKLNLNFALFHPKLVFENNIKGMKTVGLEYFMMTISVLRILGHIKYAFVKFDVLKMTKHPEDGTIKVRWRIKGISGMKVFMKFWKFRPWNIEEVIKEHIESWHDGFSVFYLGSDGLIHKLTADKMQPDNNAIVEVKNPLATKLALFLGLSPHFNNLDTLMTFNSEESNELFKMVIMSLEDMV